MNFAYRDLKLHDAVEYLLREHPDNAVAEAETALRYAQQINDQHTVDVFEEVLKQLANRV